MNCKSIFTALLLILTGGIAHAREGMWLPAQLKSREADMKAQGLQIPIDLIYNTNGTGLNNAIVLFGGGCTGEIISSSGLVLTNHHCGYGSAQRLSSPQRDMFAAGYWAMKPDQELPCPGLTVTFIRKMENVTDQIIFNLPDTSIGGQRDTIIARRIRALEKGYRTAYGMDASIQPFYRGNQYWAIVSETYRDIRLVGFPPNGIGFFGGDTDNWMWPRHNGDFSLFRVYADKKGKPAAYSAANVAYKPKQFFPICTSGYKEGDFTMVYGFPGTTQEYITASQLRQIQDIQDPIRIDARTKKLAIWNDAMAADRQVFLQYTSKRAGIANGWKKWQGEVRGLKLNDVYTKKKDGEKEFQQWANTDTTLPYADNLLAEIDATTRAANGALRAEEYIRESVLGIELIQQAAELDRLLRMSRGKSKLTEDQITAIKGQWAGFYKNYNAAADQRVFTALMPMFIDNVPKYVPEWYSEVLAANGNNYDRWARSVYNGSLIADSTRWASFISGDIDTIRIQADPAWQLYHAIAQVRDARIIPALIRYYDRMALLNRLYMKAQMTASPYRSFYPDANLTLRLTYGQVKGIDPDGPAPYSYQTNIDEIMQKEQPDNQEFQVPAMLKSLYAKKNYGR